MSTGAKNDAYVPIKTTDVKTVDTPSRTGTSNRISPTSKVVVVRGTAQQTIRFTLNVNREAEKARNLQFNGTFEEHKTTKQEF